MLEPILRLVHLSDLHFGPRTVTRLQRLTLRWAFASVLGPYLRKWEAGLSSHDGRAVKALVTSIEDAIANGDHTYDDRTRLVVTGDLTTWGDQKSLDGSLKLIDWIAVQANFREPPIVLYGNHDVWPGRPGIPRGLPLTNTRGALDAVRSQLTTPTGRFAHVYPHRFAALTFDGGKRSLSLWGIDTIQHGPWDNFFARGRVREDRYWEPAARTQRNQLLELSRLLRPNEIAVVLMHHPVHDGGTGDAVDSPDVVALALGPKQNGAPPIAPIVLSGHTHETLPKHTELPDRNPRHAPLGKEQAQLTIGTALQRPTVSTPDQVWQLLHLDYDDSTRELVVERMYYRMHFDEFLTDRDDQGQLLSEEMRLFIG